MDAKNDLTKCTSDFGLSDADLNASVMLWKQDVQQFAMGTMKLIYSVANKSYKIYCGNSSNTNRTNLSEFESPCEF